MHFKNNRKQTPGEGIPSLSYGRFRTDHIAARVAFACVPGIILRQRAGHTVVLNLIICLLVNEISERLQNALAAVGRSDLGNRAALEKLAYRIARTFLLSVE